MMIPMIISGILLGLYYFIAYKKVASTLTQFSKSRQLLVTLLSPFIVTAYAANLLAAAIFKKLEVYIFMEVSYKAQEQESVSMEELRKELENGGVQVMSLQELRQQLQEISQEDLSLPAPKKPTFH